MRVRLRNPDREIEISDRLRVIDVPSDPAIDPTSLGNTLRWRTESIGRRYPAESLPVELYGA